MWTCFIDLNHICDPRWRSKRPRPPFEANGWPTPPNRPQNLCRPVVCQESASDNVHCMRLSCTVRVIVDFVLCQLGHVGLCRLHTTWMIKVRSKQNVEAGLVVRAQNPCESRGGRPELPELRRRIGLYVIHFLPGRFFVFCCRSLASR